MTDIASGSEDGIFGMGDGTDSGNEAVVLEPGNGLGHQKRTGAVAAGSSDFDPVVADDGTSD